jgi:hypothetical protein
MHSLGIWLMFITLSCTLQLEAGPIIITNSGEAATAATSPWQIYSSIWAALLAATTTYHQATATTAAALATPASTGSTGASAGMQQRDGSAALLPPHLAGMLFDALLEACLGGLHPAAVYVLGSSWDLAAAAGVADAAEAQAAGAAAGQGLDPKVAASQRLAEATQGLGLDGPAAPAAAAAAGNRAKKRSREGDTAAAAAAGATGSSSSSRLSSSTPLRGSLAAAGMGRHALGAVAAAASAAAADGGVGAGGAEVGGGVQCDASVLRGLHDLSGESRQARSQTCILVDIVF